MVAAMCCFPKQRERRRRELGDERRKTRPGVARDLLPGLVG
jgi:hypothetical protein